MNIVFMGSAEFAIYPLEGLLAAGHRILAVVSTPAKPQGRGLYLKASPVVLWAQEHDLAPVITPQSLKDETFRDTLIALKADLFVVVAFRILPREIFSIPSMGTVNLHASLLPKFRGPAPIHRAIEQGETRTGVTVFRINEGIDTGEILLKRSLSIGSAETTPELYSRLATLGTETLVEAVALLKTGAAHFTPQENTGATPAPKLRKEEGLIDWSCDAVKIFNRVRAFKPFPGTWTHLDGKRLEIVKAEPIDCHGGLAGSICNVTNDYFDVQCGKGCLRVLTIKPEGRGVMDVCAFLRGHHLNTGTQLQ